MSQFYFYNSLYNDMREFDLPVDNYIAEAVWKQARMILGTTLQKILVEFKSDDEELLPLITELGEQIVCELEDEGELQNDTRLEVEEIWKSSLRKLTPDEKKILAFYFFSHDRQIEIFKQQHELFDNENNVNTEDEHIDSMIGKEIRKKIEQISDNELLRFCMNELWYLQDIISLDSINSFDVESITFANENFRDYLGLKNSTIDFFPRLEEDTDYWDKVLNRNEMDQDDNDVI